MIMGRADECGRRCVRATACDRTRPGPIQRAPESTHPYSLATFPDVLTYRFQSSSVVQ